jgi:hypothetical protein
MYETVMAMLLAGLPLFAIAVFKDCFVSTCVAILLIVVGGSSILTDGPTLGSYNIAAVLTWYSIFMSIYLAIMLHKGNNIDIMSGYIGQSWLKDFDAFKVEDDKYIFNMQYVTIKDGWSDETRWGYNRFISAIQHINGRKYSAHAIIMVNIALMCTISTSIAYTFGMCLGLVLTFIPTLQFGLMLWRLHAAVAYLKRFTNKGTVDE